MKIESRKVEAQCAALCTSMAPAHAFGTELEEPGLATALHHVTTTD